MATIRDPSTTTLQLTPFFTPQSPELHARAMEKVSALGAGIADMAFSEMRDDALRQGAIDGAQVVQYKDGKVLPVLSFDAPILSGTAYKKAYREQGIATYRMAALSEAQAEAQRLAALHPTDPEKAGQLFDAYITEKLTGLDSSVAPTMKPHFEAVKAGLISGTFAARERVDRQVQEKEATGHMNALIAEITANASRMEMLRQSDPKSYEENRKRYEDRWSQINSMLMAGAGWTPEQVRYNRERADVLVLAKIEADRLAAIVKGSDPDVPETRGYVIAQAQEFAKKHPRFQSDVQSLITGEVQYALGIRQYYDAQVRLEREKGVASVAVDADTARRRLRDQPDALAEYQRMMQQQIMADGRLRPQDRLARLQAIDGLTPSIQQGFQSVIAGHQMTLEQPGASVAEVRYAREAIQEIRQNPQVWQSLTTAQQVGVQRTLDQISAQQHILPDAQFTNEAVAGKQSPAAVRQRIERWQADNRVGDGPNQIRPAAVMELVSKNAAAWEKNDQQRRSAVQGIERWKRGQQPTPEEKEAIAATTPFATPDGTTFDIAKPQHMAATVEYIQRTGVAPPEVKKWFDRLSGNSSPEERTSAVSLRNTLFDMRYASLPAGRERDRLEMTEAWLGDVLGEGGYKNSLALARLGVDAKLGSDVSTPAVGRAAGAAPDASRSLMAQHLTGVADSGLLSRSLLTRASDAAHRAMLGPFYSPAEERQLALFEGDMLRTALGPLLHKSGLGGATIDKITFDPATQDLILDRAEILLSQKGAAWRTSPGLNPHRQAVIEAITQADSELGISRTIDGGYRLEFRPWAQQINARTGMNLTADQAVQFALAAHVRDARLVTWEPGTEQVISHVNVDGRVRYQLTAMGKDGLPMEISPPFAADDRKWQLGKLNMTQAIAEELRDSRVANLLHHLPGGEIFNKLIAEGKKDLIIKAEAGRLSASEWESFVVDVRRAGNMFKDGRDREWAVLQTPQAARVIAQYGRDGYFFPATTAQMPPSDRWSPPVTIKMPFLPVPPPSPPK